MEGPTKNHTARTVPVPAFVARLLETEMADRDGNALVFESARGGGYLTLGQARYAFKKAVAAVGGIDGVRLHDLRHTCASLAISAGANVKVVQRLLGHKTAVLTLDRYGHLFPDDLDAVADAFERRGICCGPTADRPILKPVSGGPKIASDLGGRCRIRTCVGVSRRIYSPLPLAARATCLGAASTP